VSLLSPLKSLVHRLGGAYARALCRREFLAQQFVGVNERPVEYRFVFENLALAMPRTVLDVGTGKTALPQLMRTCGFLVTAMDNVRDYWPSGMVNRHYHVVDDDILSPRTRGPFDMVTCISTLEHIRDHARAVRNMFALLRPGGRLVLTFPYNDARYCDNVYALPGSIGADRHPFVTQAFSRAEVEAWLAENGAAVVAQEYWRFFTGAFWTLGDRVVPPVRSSRSELHQIACLALEKRGAPAPAARDR
jgi:SAM-dependent methyltransferase